MSRPELRLVLAVSLDGRLAPAAGGAAQLGGPGDRQVLEEALAWADAVLVGARTLRLHGSTCLIHRPQLLEQRRAGDLPPQPLAIVVSRSGNIPANLPFFQQPLQRGLLQLVPPWVSAPVPPPGRGLPLQSNQGQGAGGFARQWACADWRGALAELKAAGVGRLVVLGGASLASSLAAENLLDELQLTLCPRLLGGPHSWLGPTARVDLGAQSGWQLLEQRPLPGQELLLRYRRS
ncbi:MAG: RibD family protein [Cyanobium sp.]